MVSSRRTPQNVPGQSALAYRVGTHASFKADMLAAVARMPAMRGLTTREDDDPTVALLDAWATTLDVLTFYQERIANEGFLRTATERVSLLEFGRALGYRLNPGVAASTYLAFTVDPTPGAPARVALAAGTQVQSVPAQDELPQTFETVEGIEARVEWNELRPRKTASGVPAKASQLFLKGTVTQLVVGDALLIMDGLAAGVVPVSDFRRVTGVKVVYPTLPTLDANAGYTEVSLDRPLSGSGPRKPSVHVLRRRAALFGHNAPDWRVMSEAVHDAYQTGKLESGGSPPGEWPRFNVAYEEATDDVPWRSTANERTGTAAPKLLAPPPERDQYVPQPIDTIHLDAIYPKIHVGSWVVLSTPDHTASYRVLSLGDAAKEDFALTAKTTRLKLDRADVQNYFYTRLRDTVVFAESEVLETAGRPLTAAVSGTSVVLDRAVAGLVPGQRVAISGLDSLGSAHGAVHSLAQVAIVDGLTKLVFTTPLAHALMRDTVILNANVAAATHGESKLEIIGSGDAAQVFQSFVLAEHPLTHVSAPTPSGRASTLEVRVDRVAWREVESFLGSGPEARVYATRVADDGTVSIQFGDGVTGARLPTGQNNVTATYRVGSGLAGLVAPEQLNLLLSRPLGLSSVQCALTPSGAEDPESAEDARQNVPASVLALDRVVSIQDYSDFARSFAGIGKAHASLLWGGHGRIVHLTTAGANGTPVAAGTALYQNLLAAIEAARHADHPLVIASYVALTFEVEARMLVHRDYIAKDVFAAVQAALLDRFSFRRRAFGQPVTKSDVLALMQSVPGVVALDLDALYLSGSPAALLTTLPARLATWEAGDVRPAELLTVAPLGAKLTEMR